MADRGGLENRCACERTVGSNPTLSATFKSRTETEAPMWAFFLFQRGLAEAAESRRLAQSSFSVSEWPSVSNRANLGRIGSAGKYHAISMT